MDKGFYKWVGSSTFPSQSQDQTSIYLIYLAERQPDGIYRPCTRRKRDGSTGVGFLVSKEVYDSAMAEKFAFGSDVLPEFGANGRILGLRSYR